ncbi:palmitoyl-protein thioesterase [Verticillium alfalfae VaMs.102]|uniref:Palmitoyl-protein thioesterase n=1 Tax=Verticillium alfalfae (strain VaMs.102 / ATCC MYA-4576 / FGSC 10136) TaxID=526221 RepID=C9S9A2_VERA1|nr:palmitoyl-protein thioesterase [Verticillium alfalfae VaMs.102]EEY15005.1 palmitoyl-protein thioesterase [Verticillium alfalfae VaMs.102]
MKSILPYSLLALGCLATASRQSPVSIAAADADDDTPLPLIIWHGLGDSFDGEGIQQVAELADAAFPGIYVHIVKVGADPNADRSATFFGNVSTQLEQGLRRHRRRPHPLLGPGRRRHRLLPGRPVPSRLRGALQRAPPYYRDPAPAEYEKYIESSNFLADINNERATKNSAYADNVARLVNFVMIMFEHDTTVIPKETSWFEEVNGTESLPLRARKLYTEDWIGLRALDRKGGLKFRKVPGEHMQFTNEQLNATMHEFLGPASKKFAAEAPELPLQDAWSQEL